MTPTKKPDAEKRNAEREAALTFVRMAKEKGLDLTGPDGLLKQFTKSVLETALDEEMTEHLGRAKHKKSKDGRAANTRNGTTAKTVVTDSVGVFLQIGVHSMGTIFQQHRRLVSSRNCVVGSAAFFLVIWS